MENSVGSVFKSQELVHTVKAAFLLVEVGMNVKIEGRGHVGVAEYDTDGLVVAAALNTAGGKGMAQIVEHDGWYLQSAQQPGFCFA